MAKQKIVKELDMDSFIARKKANGIVIKFRDGKMYEFSEAAWARLSNRGKSKFDDSGIIEGAKIQVIAHPTPEQEKIDISPIDIKEDEITVKTGLEDVKAPVEIKEPVEEEVKEMIEKTVTKLSEIKADDREALKAFFEGKDIEGYYDRMPTKKMYELYMKIK